MNIKRTLKSAIAALLCAALLTGCAGTAANSEATNDATSEAISIATEETSTASAEAASTADAEATATAESETPATAEALPAATAEATETIDVEIAYPESINVLAMKGPTAMGMTQLMDEDETKGYPYEFTITAAVDEIAPLVIQGKTDIVCVPANLASVLYNKTEGGVQVLAINTLGILYICENGSATVTSVDNLKGKTIYASGKGATPEYALNYILTQNGINPETDVTIEWKSEHSECLAALTTNEGSVAMLPQPFVTTAQMKTEGINVVLDLTEEWDKLGNGSACLTGAVIARTEFINSYPEVVAEFMDRYAESVEYVTTNVAEGAQLVGKYDIVPAAVAEKAIPECNIVCITGAEMKEKLSGYLNVLFEQVATSVGGALPADDFYYDA